MSKELLQGLGSVTPTGTTVILENNYLKFTGYKWAPQVENYIPIQNYNNTFQYDITYESDAGNYFYVGFERFTADKTTGSNNSTIYVITTNNNAKPITRLRGTLNLSGDIVDGKKCAYIRLRILN